MPAGPGWSLGLGLGLGLLRGCCPLAETLMSCFVFKSCFQGLSFQGGEKPGAAAGACEEPLLLLGS